MSTQTSLKSRFLIYFDISENKVFFDIFTGTTSVAQHFKTLGYTVIANDWLYFSYVLATANIEINSVPSFTKLKAKFNYSNVDDIIEYLNNLKATVDFITTNYTPYKTNNRQYFTVENGKQYALVEKNGSIENLQVILL